MQKQDQQNQNPPQQQQEILQQKQKPNARTCEFYITRKRRQCKFPAIEASKYCAAHCSDQANKIECPYEKGMFIDAAKFEKHLEICPRIKNKKLAEESQWFTKGVNLSQEQQVKATHIVSVEDIEQQTLIRVIRKIVHYFVKCFGQQAESYLHSTEEQKIEGLTNDHTQAYLLAEIAYKADLIRDNIIYLQFGAGKGILSYHIAQRVKKEYNKMSKNVLLQRETRRNKFDRFMKNNPYFQRFKSDVSDFDVSKLPLTMAQEVQKKRQDLDVQKEAAQLNELEIVGVCKHMCGAALDISVRALLKTKMSGCILASCCHQLCSYDTYLNNNFFESQGFTPDEIQIVFKISAWGTKSSTVTKQQIKLVDLAKVESSSALLGGNSKVIIGRMCKRLIDLGRAKVLKCQLLRYCSDQITPENFVLISK